MPVSIFTSLLLCSSWLASASRIEPVSEVIRDVPACQVAHDPSIVSLFAWPVQSAYTWDCLDADTELEETDDGEPEALVSEAFWVPPHLGSTSSASLIVRDRSIVGGCSRSPILRC